MDNKSCFQRMHTASGELGMHFICDFALHMGRSVVLIDTVEEIIRNLSKRELKEAEGARDFCRRLGHISSSAVVDIINGGGDTEGVTTAHIRMAARGKYSAGISRKSGEYSLISANLET